MHDLVLRVLLWVAVVIPCAAAERYEFVQPHMGTLFKITLFATDPVPAQNAVAQAFQHIALLEQVFSDYRPDSELMLLARNLPGYPARISSDLFEVLRDSQFVAHHTAGAFDITTGPMIQLWRKAMRDSQLPTDQERLTALQIVGSEKLQLDSANRTAMLRVAGMQLDLGGIAKGYAADRALALLRHYGFRQAMVAASGDLALGDAPPDANGWRINIKAIDSSSDKPMTLVATNVGISTSGDAEQFVEVNGVRYSHIINPKTGLGLTFSSSVTVIAPKASWSDSFATAYSVLETRAIQHAVQQCPITVRVLRRSRNNPKIEHFGNAPPGLISGPT